MSNALDRIFIVAALALFCVLAFRQCTNNAEKAAQYEQVTQLQHDTIVNYKDAAGRQHATKAVEQGDINVLKALHQVEIDSLSAIIGIKDKQIAAATFAGTQTTGSVKPKVDTVYRDSSGADYHLSYNDNWLTLDGSIGRTNIINYNYRDSLVFTTHKSKKGVRVDAFSLNPNTKLTGLTSLQLPPARQIRWAIGPYVGITYRQGKWEPQYGIGLHYNLFNF